jgi:hypothetical protein
MVSSITPELPFNSGKESAFAEKVFRSAVLSGSETLTLFASTSLICVEDSVGSFEDRSMTVGDALGSNDGVTCKTFGDAWSLGVSAGLENDMLRKSKGICTSPSRDVLSVRAGVCCKLSFLCA